MEEAFNSKIKHLQCHQDYYLMTEGEAGNGMIYDMYEVLEIITPEDAEGYFIHARYF